MWLQSAGHLQGMIKYPNLYYLMHALGSERLSVCYFNYTVLCVFDLSQPSFQGSDYALITLPPLQFHVGLSELPITCKVTSSN
jgi:hypothetical protein